ncbi:hypothetical protein I553_7339 [Mycobacterium xenopi 4042]|uniref:Polymorphic PE/PPE family protein n=1 Tax=Mycobacterium xenopi 4042 TaxID=1299334 RepID=X8E8S2_MYCXE|nr:hypothetical protein I553_7339 [Mycobacterium xenopi 4042]
MRCWRAGLTVLPMALPAIPARAMPLTKLPGFPGIAAGAAAVLVNGTAKAAARIAGAAVAQPRGTDSAPSEDAWPMLADTGGVVLKPAPAGPSGSGGAAGMARLARRPNDAFGGLRSFALLL